MSTGTVFKIQKFCTDDGFGIRTTVFLKGCPLNCMWCHNPEGLSVKKIIAMDFTRCVSCGACANVCACHTINENGKHVFDATNCVACGKCIETCKLDALSFCGEEMSVEEVMKQVLADKAFYKSSGGGMTLSGGEPLMQSDFARDLLIACKENGIHTCVETSNGVSFKNLEKVLPYVDLFLCDIKETDRENHKKYIGIYNDIILDNIRKIDEYGTKIQIRCPIIPSVNDRTEHFDNLIKIHKSLKNSLGIQLMPYHMLGQGKSDRYGLNLSDKAFTPPDDETVASWREYIKQNIDK